jgi:hypothetical protein
MLAALRQAWCNVGKLSMQMHTVDLHPTSDPESLPLAAPAASSSSESDSRMRALRPGRCAAALATTLPAVMSNL